MKFTEYKNEDALDLLADLLEPVSVIFKDKELVELIRENKARIEAVKLAVKRYKPELIEILARLEGVPKEEYSANLLEMTTTLLNVFNDKELVGFFTSSAQTTVVQFSGAVTETTEDKKK